MNGWICYVGMPTWFNRFLDVFQKAFSACYEEDFPVENTEGHGCWALGVLSPLMRSESNRGIST
jgi:hypothetical protein